MNRNLNKVFIDELCDIYDAEHQISEAMPELIRIAHSKSLKEGLEKHLTETHEQIARLNKIFAKLGVAPVRNMCLGIKGILNEGKQALKKYTDPELKDVALIANVQRIEHYEIACYGTLREFACELDLNDIADLLEVSLGEEGKADKKLTKLAEGGLFSPSLNKRAKGPS